MQSLILKSGGFSCTWRCKVTVFLVKTCRPSRLYLFLAFHPSLWAYQTFGRVLGEQDVDPETYTASFRVAYEPGELKAEVVKGKRAEVTFRTSGAPATIQFVPVNGGRPAGSSVISSSHNDLAYIYLRVVDADGNLCPTAEIPLDIKTSGARHIAVAGTGHSYDLHSFRSLTPTTFRGQALLIIQHQEEKGVVNITASSPKFVSNGTFSVVME